MKDEQNIQLSLAPMAEITTPALRKTIRGFGGDVLFYSEMLSAAAVIAGGKFSLARTMAMDFDRPIVYQLIGCKPDLMAEACTKLSSEGFCDIDINMGCSAPDILKKGFGSKLLTNPDLAKRIVRECRRATPGSLSVKMRSGFQSHDPELILNFCRMFESEGVDSVTLHPRPAKLSFKRKADWKLVTMLRENLNIPVTGNGDISSPEEAIKKITETGCNSVMIGREAVKSPWIFRACSDLIRNGETCFTVNIEETFLNTLESILEFLPEEMHRSRAHRFASYFSQNLTFSHALFSKIRQKSEIPSIMDIIKDYFIRNEHEKIKTISHSLKTA